MKKLLLVPIPPVLIGVFAMYKNNISPVIWGQNLLGLLISLLLSLLIIKNPKIITNKFIAPISILLLLTTFLDSGLEGIHRWIGIGPLRFYIASIVLPILIVGLSKATEVTNWWISTIITILISIIIALQPDASQTTAFIVPMIIILSSKITNNYLRLTISIVLSIIGFLSWKYLDNLSPVSYVENIVKMVGIIGIGWYISGIISLIILPLPFIIFSPKSDKLISLCVGMYYIMILISTMFGNFPVPLMGYGISPMLGYFSALAWLISAINSVSSISEPK